MKRLLFIILLALPSFAQAQRTIDVNVWNLDWPTTYTPEVVRKRQPVYIYLDTIYQEYRGRAGAKSISRAQFEKAAFYPYDMATYPADVNVLGFAYARESDHGYKVRDVAGNFMFDVTIINPDRKSEADPRVILAVGAGKFPINMISLYW